MTAAINFIWRLFQQNTDANGRNIPQVALFIDDTKLKELAFTYNNRIHFDDDFIQNIPTDSSNKSLMELCIMIRCMCGCEMTCP